MDFRDFLSPPSEIILPYIEGGFVTNGTQRFRVLNPPSPGWYRFRTEGRRAEVSEASEPLALSEISGLACVRGHAASVEGGWLATDTSLERIHLQGEVPEPFSRVIARRWYDGQLLFDTLDFEDEAELAVREALLEEAPIGQLSGVRPSLRTAFALALAMKVRGGARLSHHEVLPRVNEIAFGGKEAVRTLMGDLERRRQAALAEQRQRARSRLEARAQARQIDGSQRRVRRVLERAGAHLLQVRPVRNGEIEVTFDFRDERFVSTVEEDSLRLIDAGICLDGADPRLTLESLPGTIQEAISRGELCITRWT